MSRIYETVIDKCRKGDSTWFALGFLALNDEPVETRAKFLEDGLLLGVQILASEGKYFKDHEVFDDRYSSFLELIFSAIEDKYWLPFTVETSYGLELRQGDRHGKEGDEIRNTIAQEKASVAMRLLVELPWKGKAKVRQMVAQDESQFVDGERSILPRTRERLLFEIALRWATTKDDKEAEICFWALLRAMSLEGSSKTVAKVIRERDAIASVERFEQAFEHLKLFKEQKRGEVSHLADVFNVLAVGWVKQVADFSRPNVIKLAKIFSLLGKDASLPAWDELVETASALTMIDETGKSFTHYVYGNYASEQLITSISTISKTVFVTKPVPKAGQGLVGHMQDVSSRVESWSNPHPGVIVYLTLVETNLADTPTGGKLGVEFGR